MLSRLLVLLPLLLSIVAFVLTTLALFAGHQDGFMEDYAVARLNTSMLGQNMINATSDGSSDDDDDGSLWDKVKDKWDDVKDDIEKELNDLTGDLADELAQTLGISQWYSIHVMDACEGMYKPNATSPHAGLNVTNCTQSDPNDRFNLTKMLDHELEIGPFDLNLDDFKWPDEIQDAVNMVNDALFGLFIVYVLGMGFSGLAIFGCIAAFFVFEKPSILLINEIFATLAMLSITIGSIIVTVAAKKGVDKINKYGNDIGVAATVGDKFLTITWVAAGLMIVACVYWASHLCMLRREKKRRWTPRKSSI